jgi:glycerophosphoryl diester phosphodiesterase
MYFISHRGARSLGADNSLASIKEAANYNVAYIEFDIQHTKNNHVVLYHDSVTPNGLKLSDYTYKSLLRELPDLVDLSQALIACSGTPALIESKKIGTISRALPAIKKYPSAAITSFLEDEILVARIHSPSHKTFLMQKIHPFGLIGKAIKVNAHGIGINKNWLVIFPYIYWKCSKNNLNIYCYTLNNPLLVRLVGKIYPKMYICTDNPQKYTNRRSKI